MRAGGTRGIWALLLAGPALFLVLILGASALQVARGMAPDAVAAAVQAQAPTLLLLALAALGGLVLWRTPVRALWRGAGTWADAAIGAAVGLGLALSYLWVLAPLMEALQASPGDYVPAGAVRMALGGPGQALVFFAANVLLAPAVEETLYRGHALRGLSARHGTVAAVVLSCLAFGLLHWTGGLWYMILTATVAGGAFSGLALWRGGLLAPFAAHFALNLVEYLAIL